MRIHHVAIVAAVVMLGASCERSPPARSANTPVPSASAPATPPHAPALAEMGGQDLSCQPPDGGAGIRIDGRCLPLVVKASPPHEYDPVLHDATAAEAAAHAVGAQCRAESNAAIGDGATFVSVTCGRFHGAVPARMARIDRDGRIHHVALPPSGGARLTFVPGARPLVVAVLGDVGTMVFDARTLAGLAGWQHMGGWFNAATAGAGVAPDGAWILVPDPYGGRVDAVRAADLEMVGSVGLRGLMPLDQGPGRIEWTPGGLEMTTYPLPYE